jgi:hypothetical protein
MDVMEKSTFFVKVCPIRPQNVYDTFSDTLKVRGKVDLVKGPSKSRSRQRAEKRPISSKSFAYMGTDPLQTGLR